MATDAINVSVSAKLPYEALKDFVPISLACPGAMVLAVRSSLAVKTVEELIALRISGPDDLPFLVQKAGIRMRRRRTGTSSV